MAKKKQDETPQKEKKVKVVYYDDGSTIADMGGTKRPQRTKVPFKERARTFFRVMRQMVLPMLITLLVFSLVYVFFMLILR